MPHSRLNEVDVALQSTTTLKQDTARLLSGALSTTASKQVACRLAKLAGLVLVSHVVGGAGELACACTVCSTLLGGYGLQRQVSSAAQRAACLRVGSRVCRGAADGADHRVNTVDSSECSLNVFGLARVAIGHNCHHALNLFPVCIQREKSQQGSRQQGGTQPLHLDLGG